MPGKDWQGEAWLGEARSGKVLYAQNAISARVMGAKAHCGVGARRLRVRPMPRTRSGEDGAHRPYRERQIGDQRDEQPARTVQAVSRLACRWAASGDDGESVKRRDHSGELAGVGVGRLTPSKS